MKKQLIAGLAAALFSSLAFATPFTVTSPAGGALPSGFSQIGGIVADFVGGNGARLTAQRSGSGLFNNTGSTTAGDIVIGTQTDFTAANIAALGGTLDSAAFRLTLFDGDNATGEFDFNTNFMLIDGIEVGNFSSIQTQATSGDGLTLISTQLGFPNQRLATGWFHITDSALLGSLLAALGDGQLNYVLDQRVNTLTQTYNFAQGLSASVVDINVPPTISSVPEPGVLALAGLALAGLATTRHRRAGRSAV
jgi:hypothetical protein